MNGLVILAVLSEAFRKFGRADDSNRAQIASWVKRRIAELDGRSAELVPFVPRDFDVKARQAGEE